MTYNLKDEIIEFYPKKTLLFDDTKHSIDYLLQDEISFSKTDIYASKSIIVDNYFRQFTIYITKVVKRIRDREIITSVELFSNLNPIFDNLAIILTDHKLVTNHSNEMYQTNKELCITNLLILQYVYNNDMHVTDASLNFLYYY